MLNSDKLEFERGAAKTEGEDRNNGKENRHDGRHGTTSNLQPYQSCGRF
jgi:hypothetical protein